MRWNIYRKEHCKHNRHPTADIMVIMKTETGNSPERFLLLPLYPFLPRFPSLHLSGVQVVSHTGPSVSWLLSAKHLFHLLALCYGQLPIKHPYRQIYCCLPSIWSKSTAVKRICKPANIAAWMRNREKQTFSTIRTTVPAKEKLLTGWLVDSWGHQQKNLDELQ